MMHHIRDLQFLYRDEIGSLDQLGRFLMQPAVASVSDLAVQSCQVRTHFMATMATPLAAGKRALAPPQFFLGSLCNAWIWDNHIVAAKGEHFESEIHANR